MTPHSLGAARYLISTRASITFARALEIINVRGCFFITAEGKNERLGEARAFNAEPIRRATAAATVAI